MNSSSNFLPCCRNINFLLSKISPLTKFGNIHEPMISVQAQRQTREPIPSSIKCKSNYTDQCYAEYNTNSLRRGFGQLKDIRYETNDLGKPSLVIHSSTLVKDENDIVILTNDVLKELANVEMRKRYAIVHTEKYVYIVGGYIYDIRIPERRKPLNDFKYDIKTKKLIPTQTVPSAVGFGLCIDDDYIYAIGGNDLDNRALSDCFAFTLQKSTESWIKLPSLPAPTTGPGVGVYDGQIHCIGGFDVLGNDSIAHGEYLHLRYPKDHQWQYGPELEITRARPLVLIIPDKSINGESIYVAGGFNINRHTAKPHIVPDLQVLNATAHRWQRITTIPNLDLSHALSFNDNRLHISQTIELDNQLPETKILRSFDLENRIWIDPNDEKRKSENSLNKIRLSKLSVPPSKTEQRKSNTSTIHKSPRTFNTKLKNSSTPKHSA